MRVVIEKGKHVGHRRIRKKGKVETIGLLLQKLLDDGFLKDDVESICNTTQSRCIVNANDFFGFNFAM
jgi:hypothetical protein